MGISYQDVDTRLRVAEDKLEFLLNFFTVRKQVPDFLNPGRAFVVKEATLKEVYYELKAMGPDVVIERVDGGLGADIPEAEVVPEDSPAEQSGNSVGL